MREADRITASGVPSSVLVAVVRDALPMDDGCGRHALRPSSALKELARRVSLYRFWVGPLLLCGVVLGAMGMALIVIWAQTMR